jgi:hypothetical protein
MDYDHASIETIDVDLVDDRPPGPDTTPAETEDIERIYDAIEDHLRRYMMPRKTCPGCKQRVLGENAAATVMLPNQLVPDVQQFGDARCSFCGYPATMQHRIRVRVGGDAVATIYFEGALFYHPDCLWTPGEE